MIQSGIILWHIPGHVGARITSLKRITSYLNMLLLCIHIIAHVSMCETVYKRISRFLLQQQAFFAYLECTGRPYQVCNMVVAKNQNKMNVESSFAGALWSLTSQHEFHELRQFMQFLCYYIVQTNWLKICASIWGKCFMNFFQDIHNNFSIN